MGFRRLKAEISSLLRKDGFQPSVLDRLDAPPSQKINPLISLLYHGEAMLRWRSVAAIGHVVAQMAATTGLEDARVVMRRLMWNLNDESGGIGWGSPEAMAEIMACQQRLAREYACILVSYLNPQGNFLEHAGLQQGVLWGIGRLGRRHSDLVTPAGPFLAPFFSHVDPAVRGMAVWAGSALNDRRMWPLIRFLQTDTAECVLFADNRLQTLSIATLVARLSRQPE